MLKQDFFNKSVEETLKALETDSKKGLSSAEVESRLAKYGENRLEGAKGKTKFEMLIEQLKDFLVIILIIAALISTVMAFFDPHHSFVDGIIIFAIVVINAILGVYQESKASDALKALKEMSSPQAKVIRDGQIEKVPSNLIVPGDMVSLDAGDYLPADVRLVDTMNLKIDEAALTGESVASDKHEDSIVDDDAGIGDMDNCGFMGTIVTYGRGTAVVTGTGMSTEMGKIATMLGEEEDEITPLQRLLDAFGKMLGTLCLIVCGIIFLIGFFFIDDMGFFEIFMTAIALAVAAIPEGLTIVVTVILSLGMQRMVSKNVIIKKLSAVETLGSTTVICSDKTGTLTQNKMTVVKVFDNSNEYEVEGTGYSSKGTIKTPDGNLPENLRLLVEGAVLCNDAIFNEKEEKIIGDPTEGALVVLGSKVGINLESLAGVSKRANELPFDSTRKLMSTFHNYNGKIRMYTKGAPDELLARCTKIFVNGEIRPLTDDDRKNIAQNNEKCAKQALRVLATAFKDLDELKDIENQEAELVFLGLLCMIDPPREEVKDSIKLCKRAGITTKMITGDHGITAHAIAVDLGITDKDGRVVTGKEITEMSDEELTEIVKDVNVFARVSPEHKVRLVTAVKANKNIAAMTGDGVNDAPSLKRADIGVAMGITGTDVSKEASDMILTDDNFASIVTAVEEGRTIYSNIRKVIGYLISCNIGEILVILVGMILNIFNPDLPHVPLVTVQLLSINLITDAFPAFALGMELKEDGVMDKKPRDPSAPIMDKKMTTSIVFQSIGLAIGCIASFLIGYNRTLGIADNELRYNTIYTFTFVTIVVGELLRAYSARSENKTIFKMKLFENSFLNKSVIFSFTFLLITIYTPLNGIFKTAPLDITNFLIAISFSVLPIIFGELTKLYTRKMEEGVK